MKKETKSQQQNELSYIFSNNFAAKLLTIKDMKKKMVLMFIMVLMPMLMYSTSVCIDNSWVEKGRSLSFSSLNLMEKSGNVSCNKRLMK